MSGRFKIRRTPSVPVALLLGVLLFWGWAGGLRLALAAASQPADSVTVTGQVLFDSGAPVAGARVQAALVGLEQRYLPLVSNNSAGTAAGIGPAVSSPHPSTDETVTDANGNFSLQLAPGLPVRVLTTIEFRSGSLPVVKTARWGDVAGPTLALGILVIPNPQEAALTLTAGEAHSADGALQVLGLPGNVQQMYGKTYDPDLNATAFPGEFAESGRFPLNSSVFTWLEALDAAGNPVDQLEQAVMIRSRIAPAQWPDLEDITAGTDRIEIPIYTLDETTLAWTQMGIGWLEDADRTILPEDAQSVILDRTFAGELYATFQTAHFSWMNVDYPSIGPWTLHRLESGRRNTDCFYEGARLAETIFRTNWANTAYGDVNKPGTNLQDEVKDAGGSEIKADAALAADTYGETRPGDFKENLYLNDKLWGSCEAHKQTTSCLMAVTLLHETAHWKHDAKKFDGVYTEESDVGGEGGLRIEGNLFGGRTLWAKNGLPIGADGLIARDTTGAHPITPAQLDKLCSPQWWRDNDANFNQAFWDTFWAGGSFSQAGLSAEDAAQAPLRLTLTAPSPTVELGAPVLVTLEYENISTAPIQVLNLALVEGYPLYFTIRSTDGAPVPFRGPKVKYDVRDEDFVTLAPGAKLQQTLDLTYNEGRGTPRYPFLHGGVYTVTAFYAGYFGLPETTANPVVLTLSAGGKVTGLVTSATTGQPISGTNVSALRKSEPLDLAVSGTEGLYTFDELPTGVYTFEARAPGFLRVSQTDVQVTAGQTTTLNFSLSPLLAQGELRLVLTWGEEPSDLDSHLWLPEPQPYHVWFSRKGSLDACPFAVLDVDATSSFGPETITIKQRVLQGTYVYAIYNFSRTPELTASQAKVQVFDATGLIAMIEVPQTGAGAWWQVLTIDGATGAITEINQLVEGDFAGVPSPAPYADTGAGCEPESAAAEAAPAIPVKDDLR